MSLGTILLILLVLMMFASVPAYPYSRGWGYAPFGGLASILLLIVVLMMIGVIPTDWDVPNEINVDIPEVNVSKTSGGE